MFPLLDETAGSNSYRVELTQRLAFTNQGLRGEKAVRSVPSRLHCYIQSYSSSGQRHRVKRYRRKHAAR